MRERTRVTAAEPGPTQMVDMALARLAAGE
jgi:hypothetical protein